MVLWGQPQSQSRGYKVDLPNSQPHTEINPSSSGKAAMVANLAAISAPSHADYEQCAPAARQLPSPGHAWRPAEPSLVPATCLLHWAWPLVPLAHVVMSPSSFSMGRRRRPLRGVPSLPQISPSLLGRSPINRRTNQTRSSPGNSSEYHGTSVSCQV